jgi:RNA polymerase sigma-70 factor (ECF subfamily)
MAAGLPGLGVTDRLPPVLRRGKDRASVLVKYDVDRSAVEAARRDPRAFEALYRKYVAQVYSFALYELRDTHAAEDLTAQVFLRALAGLPSFREQDEPPGSSFRVWLFQVARHTLSNERRRVRRHPAAPLELAFEIAADDDVQSAVAERDQLARAWEQIERLPTERRQALLLRFVEEMSTREIGEVLGKSEGATRVLIHRALRSVAQQLGRGSDAPRH